MEGVQIQRSSGDDQAPAMHGGGAFAEGPVHGLGEVVMSLFFERGAQHSL